MPTAVDSFAGEDPGLVRLLGESLPDPVIITDAVIDPPGPRIVFVNKAFSDITGYAAEEVVGKTPRLLQGANTERAELDRVRSAMERGEPFFGRVTNYAKDGKEILFEWNLTPIIGANGAVANWISIQGIRRKEPAAPLGVVFVGVEPLAAMGYRQLIGTIIDNIDADVVPAGENVSVIRRADLFVVGVGGHGGVPAETVGRLRLRHPDSSVLVHLGDADLEIALTVIHAGARAVILPSTSERIVPEIVRLVLAGGRYVPWEIASMALPRAPADAALPEVVDHLSRRQREILGLIGQGLPNEQIATVLGLQLSTVKGHVTRMLKELGLRNRTQAALLAAKVERVGDR